MAEQQSAEERTELPTHRRLEKAHEEGRVPRSQELSGAMILLAGTLALATAGGAAVANRVMSLTVEGGRWLTIDNLDQPLAVSVLRTTLLNVLGAVLPFAIVVTVVALVVNLLQARGVVSMEPVTPKLSKVSPLAGLKRLVSWQAPFNLLKSVLKLAFLSAVTYVTLKGAWPEILGLSEHEAPGVLLLMRRLALKLGFATGLSFLVIAAIDYFFQVRQHIRQLKMTKQEVVREHKETEGDPLIKSRVRALARALSRKRMLADVAKADVVVTNPTHLAVALKYDPAVAAAPVVLAMGQRKLAERIKAAARAAGVPLVENKPLAQALVATAVVGMPIPPALYLAVAEVIAFVYRRRGGMAAAALGPGGRP